MSREIKHTPGPWRTLEKFGRCHDNLVIADRAEKRAIYPTKNIPDIVVCSCNGCDENAMEKPYNAQLIASAPELLEKLKQICDGCEISHDKDNLCCRDKEECDKCGIRVLIAKAEGKS